MRMHSLLLLLLGSLPADGETQPHQAVPLFRAGIDIGGFELIHPLRARHYAVLPLGPRSGLIQWVQGATPLFALYKASQQRAHAAALLKEKGAKDGGAAGGDGGGGGADGRRSERPSDLFYAKLMPALAARGISESAPRREWPFAQSAFRSMHLFASSSAALKSAFAACAPLRLL